MQHAFKLDVFELPGMIGFFYGHFIATNVTLNPHYHTITVKKVQAFKAEILNEYT